MGHVRISELSEDIRRIVAQAFQKGGIVVEDGLARPLVTLFSCRRPTPAEKQQAEESLERLRRKTGQAMRESGVTEDDIVKEILQND